MNKKEFKELLDKKVLLLDGATGSNLQKRGMPTGVCPELWICDHPDVLQGLQKEYVSAGSNIVYAPTFGGNRIKMAEYGLLDRMEQINMKLVQISKDGVGDGAFVAGDITMTGAQLEPLGHLKFEELIDIYKEQISIIVKAGVDLIVVETMMSLQETRAAVIAAKEVCSDLPIMATLSFSETGKTLYGADAAATVVVLQSLGVDAVGLNCSAGPDKMKSVFDKMKSVAKIPLIVKPNAGLPQIDSEGNTTYDMSPEEFKAYMKDIIFGGAKLAGGCCGTSPEYINALKEFVDEMPALEVVESTDVEDNFTLASERQVYILKKGVTLEFGAGIDFSDDDICEEYLNGEFDSAIDKAFELQDDEVDALLFKAVADGIDEADALIEMITEVTSMVPMPVVAAVSSVETASKVLKHYSGIMGILPLFDDCAETEQLFNTLKWYGAKIVTIDKQMLCC